MRKFLVINGPNLNMLGIREKNVYGAKTLKQINEYILNETNNLDIEIEFFQSNHEGSMIDKIHEAYGTKDAIVINAGAYTHYSYALRDAISAIAPIPCAEVHLSDISARESFRNISVIREVCVLQICGQGEKGYVLAINRLMEGLI
ncbi:MAG: type II 3-dehydroquinate dehydratase [Christensenellaceae bacterium]